MKMSATGMYVTRLVMAFFFASLLLAGCVKPGSEQTVPSGSSTTPSASSAAPKTAAPQTAAPQQGTPQAGSLSAPTPQ